MDGLEEVLNRYLAVIDAEDSLLKSYRSFFLVLEGLIFPVILYIGRSNTGFLSLYNISGGKIVFLALSSAGISLLLLAFYYVSYGFFFINIGYILYAIKTPNLFTLYLRRLAISW